MNFVPPGWTRASVEAVCVPINKHDPRDHPGEEFNYIDIGGIEGQRIKETKRLAGAIAPSRARQIVKAGDIVLATVRTYLKKTALVPAELDGATASTGFCVLRPNAAIDSRFLFYRVTESGFVADLSARQTGSSYPAIRDRDVFERPIELPPLSEQRRIVAAIEEQFSRLDAADGLLAQVRSRLTMLRSAVLRGAFDGSWPTVRIGDVAHVGSGATPKRDKVEYWVDGTIPWVTSGQLTRPFVNEPAALITKRALEETNVKLWPKHTLLVALYGEGKTRGHCSELLIESTTNQACAAIVLHDESVNREYVKLFFAASYDANRRLAAGGVQPNLSLGLIKDLRFPLPDPDEQRAVVDHLARQLSLVESLDHSLETASRRSAALRHSILERAFRGELVPQDPSDEPASVLLERIAAERATATKATGTRARRRASMQGR